MLDINYPFHSAEVEPIKKGLIADLASIKPTKAILPFYSAVTGSCLEGSEMDGDYWWQNVRQPVRFLSAVEAAFADEQTQFLEIGPRAILKSYIGETARDRTKTVVAIESLTQKTPREMDPVLIAASRAIANGLSFDKVVIFGEKQACSVPLPSYPWQLKPFKITPSSEAFDIFNDKVIRTPCSASRSATRSMSGRPTRHRPDPLSGQSQGRRKGHSARSRLCRNGPRGSPDRLWDRPGGTARHGPVAGPPAQRRTVASLLTRLDTTSGVVEISSRTRLVDEEWQLHAKCRVAKIPRRCGR